MLTNFCKKIKVFLVCFGLNAHKKFHVLTVFLKNRNKLKTINTGVFIKAY